MKIDNFSLITKLDYVSTLLLILIMEEVFTIPVMTP